MTKPRFDVTYLDGYVNGSRLWQTLKLTSLDGPLGPWRFDADRVPPGRYEVRVFQAQYFAEYVLGPRGETNARIEVPARGTVAVRVIDTRTGKDADIENIHWGMRAPKGAYTMHGWFGKKEANEFVFRAPAGTAEVTANNELFFAKPCSVEVVAGERTETTLYVTPSGRIDVVFTEGDARVPYEWKWKVDATRIDNDEKNYLDNGEAGALQLWVAGAGRYRVRVEPIPGYEPIPEHEVYVALRKATRVVVKLVRAREPACLVCSSGRAR